MDHSRFNDVDDGFDVMLDLRADLEFKTSSSISFVLHQEGFERGSVEVHHPCDGHIRVRIRGEMSKSRAPNLDRSTGEAIVAALFRELSIPADETYEARFVGSAGQHMVLEQRVDRDGMTDVYRVVRKVK